MSDSVYKRPVGFRLKDVSVGMTFPALVKQPTTSMIFRFSAVTWNAHRIHYDQAYARSENHPDVLVQATMHGAFMVELLQQIAGPHGTIKSLDYMNRGRAIPGDILRSEATVTNIDTQNGEVTCDVKETNQDGLVCAKGTAVVILER